MQKDSNNQRTILQQILPSWIPESESKLNEAIEDELQRSE